MPLITSREQSPTQTNIVFDPALPGFCCLKCKESEIFAMSVSVEQVSSIMAAFTARHAACARPASASMNVSELETRYKRLSWYIEQDVLHTLPGTEARKRAEEARANIATITDALASALGVKIGGAK